MKKLGTATKAIAQGDTVYNTDIIKEVEVKNNWKEEMVNKYVKKYGDKYISKQTFETLLKEFIFETNGKN